MTINEPGDEYEREADEVADSVMRMESPSFESELENGGSPALMRKCSCAGGDSCPECVNEDVMRRASDSSPISEVPPIVTETVRSAGSALNSSALAFLEPRFGRHLSNVRVHTDSTAADSARAINALAYTVGSDIVFGAGKYSPDTDDGRRLLAHEVAHVIQQTGQRASKVLRQQPAETPKPEEPKKDPEIQFGKPGWFLPVFDKLILKLPARWQLAYDAFKKTGEPQLFDTSLGRTLLYNQIMAGLNLFHAGVFTGISPYKPDFSKGLEMAESLSGVADSYLNLVSLALRLDLKKYLENELPDLAMNNLGWAILYGLGIQGGAVAVNALSESDLDFTSILSKPLKKFTDAPRGLARPFRLGNIPDPRWSSYAFGAAPGGFGLKLSGVYDPAKPYTFTSTFGLNIAQLADLYPKKEEDKAKYKGFELFPYFTYSHSWSKDPNEPVDPNAPVPGGVLPPKTRNQWLAGVFVGGEAFYTLLEAGAKHGPDEALQEFYLRSGITARDLGPLTDTQLTAEASFRPNESKFRGRLNAATNIKLVDNKTFQFTLGGAMGYLLPTSASPGAFDFGGGISMYHKYGMGEGKDPLKTGFDLSTTYRTEDPFNPASANLFSFRGGLNLADFFKFSIEYHKVTGEPLDQALPGEDVRFMIYPGPAIIPFDIGK